MSTLMSSKIFQSNQNDIDEIFRLYELATAYQLIKFPTNLWPTFDRAMVINEINESRQYKLVIGDTIACVWATTLSDPEIWQEKNLDAAIYIHRIATNPDFRGYNFVATIVEWAKTFAADNALEYVRLDTCGDNKGLIKHYTDCGFTFLGMNKIKDATGLPSHYIDADVCYFEIDMRISRL
jgi:ribosomal protein S18 acetylase RimI-like enzyme